MEATARLKAADAVVLARAQEADDARRDLAAAIVHALTDGGLKPSEVDRLCHYDRNHIRRIAAAGGVEARKRPTVRALDEGDGDQ